MNAPQIRLVDAPILVLDFFHKALRAEFDQLRRIVVEAAEKTGPYSDHLVTDLRNRFEFLKLFYKYHSAAEDEVCVCVFWFSLLLLLVFWFLVLILIRESDCEVVLIE